MPRLLLLSVTKRLSPSISTLMNTYFRRVQSAQCEHLSLPPEPGDPKAASAKETEKLLAKAHAQKGLGTLIALNPEGEALDSERFSAYLFGRLERGVVAFLLGGAYGLDRQLLKTHRAHSLSLSTLTFSHELCHLVLAEQIYRADTLKRNHPYHHGGG